MASMVIRKDILIVGGGLVGASLALALRRSRYEVALLESRPPGETPRTADHWDSRIYAVSPASRDFLSRLGVWQKLDASRVAPVLQMQVCGDRKSKLGFSAHESGIEALAWIVESGAMTRALWDALSHQSNLELFCPAVPNALATGDASVRVTLDDAREVEARLVVGADGARSFVREAAGISTQSIPYGQSGVVANFSCERAHRSVAYQWFRKDGVLAWLPLPGNRISMVWSTPQDHAEELRSLPEAALCARVAEAGSGTLGALQLLTPAAAFPLSMMNAKSPIGARVALVGDAAHVVHPLAGQGVNLGFGDAEVLASELVRASGMGGPGSDPGARMLLRRYERSRAEDVLAMRAATHGLSRLFGTDLPGAGMLRNWGVDLVDRLPVMKNLLVSQAVASPAKAGRDGAGKAWNH
jgi:2-octaprenylphenol hydroxylase